MISMPIKCQRPTFFSVWCQSAVTVFGQVLKWRHILQISTPLSSSTIEKVNVYNCLVHPRAWYELLSLKTPFAMVQTRGEFRSYSYLSTANVCCHYHDSELPWSQKNRSEVLVITLEGRILIPLRLKQLLNLTHIISITGFSRNTAISKSYASASKLNM